MVPILPIAFSVFKMDWHYFKYQIHQHTNQTIISKSIKMKTHKFLLLSFLFLCFSFMAVAQTKSEKFSVSGECGTCKNKIEKAAKAAGASYAMWDVDSRS